MLPAGDNALDDGITKEEFLDVIRNVTQYMLTGHPEKTEGVYEAFRMYYSPWGQLDDIKANREQMSKVSLETFMAVIQ